MKRIWTILLGATILGGAALGIFKLVSGDMELADNGRFRLLLYAELSNRILVVEGNANQPIDTRVAGRSLGHHAYPAFAPDGTAVAFVRPSGAAGAEDIVLRKWSKHEESLLLSWPGSVWSLSFSPGGSHLAFVADRSGPTRNTSLYLCDLATRDVENVTPEVRWVSVYSSPSWSPNGDRIAFEEYSRTQEGDLHKVKIVALGDRSITTIADGWFPSWSPNGNEVAFITTNGSRCYEVDLRSHERRLIWWSFRTLLADDIIGPALWAPADYGVFLNVTSGIKGDMRDGYYVDIASGKTRRISYDPDFEVVGLQMQKDRGRTEPRASRSDFR